MKLTLNLQLFADGGASAGASSSTGAIGATAPTTGESSANPNPVGNENVKPKVVYGKQDKPIEETQPQQNQQVQRMSFEELVKSKDYLTEAQEYMDKAFQRRLKKYKGIEEENSKMRAILDIQNGRYGLDPNSATYLDDYAQKVESDTKLYEEEAIAKGLPVEEYMKVKQAERIIEQNKRFEQNRERESVVQKHLNNIIGQAEKLQKDFPNFNLENELANPQFKRMVDPPELGGSGISVADAFFALHRKEIMQATISNAVNQAQIKTANVVATNKSRPAENGLSKNASVVVKDDPSQLKLDDFKKIREEYLRTGYRPKFY